MSAPISPVPSFTSDSQSSTSSSSSEVSSPSTSDSSGSEKIQKPKSLLARLIKAGKVAKIEDVFERKIPINETDSIDILMGKTLESRVLKVMPSVQFVRKFYERVRYRVVVAVGDRRGRVGLGSSFGGTIKAATVGAEKNAKLNLISIKLDVFSANDLKNCPPHTIPKVAIGTYGTFEAVLQPAPRGTGIKGSVVAKVLLELGGVEDCYTVPTLILHQHADFLFAVFKALKTL